MLASPRSSVRNPPRSQAQCSYFTGLKSRELTLGKTSCSKSYEVR